VVVSGDEAHDMPKTGPTVKRPKAKSRAPKAVVARPARSAPPPADDYDDDDDGLDAFVHRRDRDSDRALGLLEAEGSGDEEEEEDVMPLTARASMHDDEDDDEEEDEEEDEEDEEEDGEDSEAEEGGTGVTALGWGSRKRDLYGGHDDDEDDEDELELDERERADKLEEAEALKLQQAHAARLRAEDFDELLPAKAAAAPSKRTHSAREQQSLEQELAELPPALRAQARAGGGAQMETVARDGSGLNEAERLRIVEADAPELQALLAEFQESLKEAKERLEPVLEVARKRQLTNDGGVRLLELKLQLLLSYCINLAFYLMLKSQGRAVRTHPVIDALLRHRLLLERMRPLETKLHYRLTKLLQLAAAADAPGDARGLTDAQQDLSERPNPEALLAKGGGARAAAAKGDEDDEDAEPDDGLYRPPKLAAVHYDDEPGGAKRRRQQERAVERASASRMVRELRAELSEAPQPVHADDFGRAIDADSSAVARFRKDEEERRAYEESNFRRLNPTKAEKIALKRRQAAATGVAVDELAAFDDFSHLYEVATTQAVDPRAERVRALKQYMNSLEQRGGQNARKPGRSAEEDAPSRTLEGRSEKRAEKEAKRAAKAALQDEDEGADEDGYDNSGAAGRKRRRSSLDELPAVDPYYKEVAEQSQNKKAAKAVRRVAEAAEAAAAFASTELAEAAPDEARKVGRDIEKNRGLTRQRKKIDGNVRVKNREKFRKAVIRRNGQVRAVQTQSDGPYGGEATGIKKNVSHSKRFA
jgi:U3 small nucleolar RNA-associated protein 3